ncbi:MAG: phospho-N-acetylmuramoyl-pentapeptide-transferase [Rickettsiales bacterium]|nr:phospho-N-acetylmuramoyl-pentapeptide-transferase [Rickettsiales bacterium]OUV53292.1 MAG: phospho-N-acetylmuramoyl-pentapeptide-transferase [Rickettsiales bacterium TMED127]|tara:strand:+ start:7901 stop:8989 length:1089 start_codon:yes stop_codon:yes gene_type:complete
MFYYFLLPLVEHFNFLNLFKYISFRAGGALFTSLTISFLIGPFLIKTLKNIQKNGQPIRKDGPESHIIKKAGTPTMGGTLILFSLFISVILWGNLQNIIVWLVIFVTLAFGLIGAFDDYKKLKTNSSDGFNGKVRLVLEFLISIIFVYYFNQFSPDSLKNLISIPYTKNITVDLNYLYIPFCSFVIVGTANSVNLTDGLDGLAIGPVMITALAFAIIAYFTGNFIFSDYLKISFIPGSGELVIICAALVGSGLGFLWYNAPPAMVFMGDTGSLAVGGTIGAVAVATKHEIILAIVGGLFVLETISVIMQVFSYKLTGKRIFKMAPLHHHFEQKGWSESTIVIRFWIISVVLALLGLASLKLR